MLDDSLLLEYMETFYGYGSLNGKYWFIGMEEGSSGRIEEIAHRLDVWQELGKSPVEDLVRYHRKLGVDCFFRPNAKLQPTWNKLIRIILSVEGHTVHKEMVKEFQRTKFGIHTGNNCILERLPLPSKSTGTWIYNEHSCIPELQSRECYRHVWMPKREPLLRELITRHRPEYVVFYSINPIYKDWWKKIANIATEWNYIDGVQFANNEHTIFAITKHPVAKGITSEYFHTIGKNLVRERVKLLG